MAIVSNIRVGRPQTHPSNRLYECTVRTGLSTREAALEQLLCVSAEGMVP